MFTTLYHQVDLIICSTFCRFYKMIKCEEGMSIWLICLKLPASYYYEVRVCLKKLFHFHHQTVLHRMCKKITRFYFVNVGIQQKKKLKNSRNKCYFISLSKFFHLQNKRDIGITLLSCKWRNSERENLKWYVFLEFSSSIFCWYILFTK